MTAGFVDTASEQNVYRVTREKLGSCFKKNCKHEISEITYGFGSHACFYHWVRTTKICSKRSALLQVNHLVKPDGSQRYPQERLISVERAPYQAFEDVTEECKNHAKGYLY